MFPALTRGWDCCELCMAQTANQQISIWSHAMTLEKVRGAKLVVASSNGHKSLELRSHVRLRRDVEYAY